MIEIQQDRIILHFLEFQQNVTALADEFTEQIFPEINAQTNQSGQSRLHYSTERVRPDQQVVGMIDERTVYAETLADRTKRIIRKCLWNDYFTYPEWNASPKLEICFNRRFRIPHDGRLYYPPEPGKLGRLSIISAAKFSKGVPTKWRTAGDALVQIYQSEAFTMEFWSTLPLALRVSTATHDALTGDPVCNTLISHPQNYLAIHGKNCLHERSTGAGRGCEWVANPQTFLNAEGRKVQPQESTLAINFTAHTLRPEVHLRERVLDRWALIRECILSGRDDCLREVVSLICPSNGDTDVFEFGEYAITRSVGPRPDSRCAGEWEAHPSQRVTARMCDFVQSRKLTNDISRVIPLTEAQYRESDIPWFDYYRGNLQSSLRLQK